MTCILACYMESGTSWMASDDKVVSSTGLFIGNSDKIRTFDSNLVGMAGDVKVICHLEGLDWADFNSNAAREFSSDIARICKELDVPVEDVDILVLTPEGLVCFSGDTYLPIAPGMVMGIGSGAPYALGAYNALDLGVEESLEAAFKITSQLDVYTGSDFSLYFLE